MDQIVGIRCRGVPHGNRDLTSHITQDLTDVRVCRRGRQQTPGLSGGGVAQTRTATRDDHPGPEHLREDGPGGEGLESVSGGGRLRQHPHDPAKLVLSGAPGSPCAGA